MKIEVFGPGCAKCKTTAENARQAIEQAGVEAEVVKVEKIDEIMKRGVMLTPAVYIDGKKCSEGKLIKTEQIREWIQEKINKGES